MDDAMVQVAIDAARSAGKVILPYYRKNIKSDSKEDGSPLTLADKESHKIISLLLEKTGIGVVSEEGEHHRLEEQTYWLVDPLDGTKEFIADNDEFTINIALMENSKPVLGVVYAPALDELYVGVAGKGAWCEKQGRRTECHPLPKSQALKMATSRFHDHAGTDVFAGQNNVAERVAVGSALKYGRLALGDIDVYPRLVGTSEWDTAAGQAVLEAVGGSIIDWQTGRPLQYGKDKRRNGAFIALRAPYVLGDFNLENL